ncbi:polyadenylate-binding protein-interacting protein 5-like [Benincasa hispida]|uniref:polyadenylate-binding protein-interacting protein 5-like n=1 Tax=Benincasa hispida TaxID=102211 RepID=UPI001900CFCF|nr:polyadenylate-binding protein-interacting protein 5-like [Benincasa hispida]
MNPHGSSLNPYATSYIPLSQRGANRTFVAENSSRENIGSKRTFIVENASRENIGANLPGYSEQCVYNPPYSNISPRLNMHHGKKAPVAAASAVKNHPFHGSLSQQSGDLTEMEMFDREVNMDLELLQVSFPGLSEQSLTDVYFANKGDLDAAIDMLSQLENKHPHDVEYDPESLPDTLDIGDISESGFVAVDQASFRMKNVANHASTSSRF